MPALLLPFNLAPAGIAEEKSLPPLFHTARFPDCPVTLSDIPAGSIWQQELGVNGFIVGQQLMLFRSEETITCRLAVDSALLLFILDGTLRLQTGKSVLTQLEVRHYCLVTGGFGESVVWRISEGHTHIFQLAFSMLMLQKLTGQISSPFSNQDGSVAGSIQASDYQLEISKPIKQLINKLFSIGMKPGTYDILRLNELCLKLLKRFTDDRAIHRAQQRWIEKKQLSITELAAFLTDHLDIAARKQVTLAACARRTGLEIPLFKKIFKSHYGVTLSKYLYQQRMQRARFLLSQSGQLPGAVYGEVGYHNFSSFSRAYAGYFGQPPSAFRIKLKS